MMVLFTMQVCTLRFGPNTGKFRVSLNYRVISATRGTVSLIVTNFKAK